MIAYILGLPRWAQGALCAVGLALLLWGAKTLYDRAVIDRYESKVALQAAKAERAGNEAAGAAVTETRNEVEKSNVDARKAALGSDDPLRAGLDSLRSGAPSPRPTTR